jgi:dihydroorotate dehydrogenase (fumarate)
MPLNINPPLLNSSSPWATTIEDLQSLYECPHTGAVSTRTSLLKEGFNHDNAIHQFTFFDAGKGSAISKTVSKPTAKANGAEKSSSAQGISSLNTLGYSPIPLSQYCCMIKNIVSTSSTKGKPFIVSVTGSAEEVGECYRIIVTKAFEDALPLHMEVNLSCPNIAGKPPPAYDKAMLLEYLHVLGKIKAELGETAGSRETGAHEVLVGIKTPPYTYMGQFQGLVEALAEAAKVFNGKCPVDFITATNTLGSSLILDVDGTPELNSETGTGIGGMAGASLHPLSVGNVATIRKLLDQNEQLKGLDIIGVGGVADADGFLRMRKVGASAVALATALGREGVGVFEKIAGHWKPE